jgi:hypothetical protein
LAVTRWSVFTSRLEPAWRWVPGWTPVPAIWPVCLGRRRAVPVASLRVLSPRVAAQAVPRRALLRRALLRRAMLRRAMLRRAMLRRAVPGRAIPARRGRKLRVGACGAVRPRLGVRAISRARQPMSRPCRRPALIIGTELARRVPRRSLPFLPGLLAPVARLVGSDRWAVAFALRRATAMPRLLPRALPMIVLPAGSGLPPIGAA